MASEAQLRANRKYEKEKTKSYFLRLNKKTDADIIEKLDSLDNKQGYLKKLIRSDLE